MSDDISIPSPTYRVPRHSRGMDPATRKLGLIAAGIAGILLVVAGGWSILSHRSHGVPVVQAESGPLKVKPANPGGLQVAGMNNDIFSGGSDTDVEKLAPPPQTPDPQALQEQSMKAAAAPPAASPAEARAAPETRAGPAAIAPPASAIAREAPVARQALPQPLPVVPPAAATPPARTLAANVPPPVRPADRPAATTAPDHVSGSKGALVQLAALSSEQAAREEWDRLVKRWPDVFGGHRPAFSKVEHDGHAFWRVRTGGFDGVAQATTFCQRLRAKGAGCSVADF